MAKTSTVDSVTPRGKAFFHALLPAIAYFLGFPVAPWILAITGAAMALSVVGGPRYSLIGKLFNQAVRPALNINKGKPEEAAPHRFAEAVGAIFLLAAAAAYWAGAHGLGEILALIVVALAALNSFAGICVGCQMYLVLRRTQARVAA